MSKNEVQTPAALNGLRIVELGEGIAAPYAAKLLGDFGAEVIKVETGSGDWTRLRGPFPDAVADPEASGLFSYLNTNKRGVVLDLDAENGRSQFNRLLGSADVVVLGFPAAQLQSWGVDIHDLRRQYPSLIIVDVSPFGHEGPYKDWQGSEIVTFSMGGLAYTTPGFPDAATPEEGPLRPNSFVAGTVAGLVAAISTISAVQASRKTNDGCLVEVTEQAALAGLQQREMNNPSYVKDYKYIREFTVLNNGRMPNFYLPSKDGSVAVPALLESHWHQLVIAMGSPDWAVSGKFSTQAGRNDNRVELAELMTEWTMKLTGDELYAIALEKELLVFPFYPVAKMAQSAHVAERGSLASLELKRECRMPGPPLKMIGSPWSLRRPAPRLGQHTDEIAKESADRDAPSTAIAEKPQLPANARRPLDGIKVLDFGQFIAVPFCTLWLAWLGAEVISIETRKRATTRNGAPFAEGHAGDPNASGYYNLLYSSKKSITVDLSTPKGRAIVRKIADSVDIVVDNFTSGVMEKLGFGYDELVKSNPRLIGLSSGAFGRSGPMRKARGMHSAVNLFSGVADVTGYRGGGPRILGAALPDPLAGTYSCFGILVALENRERTGKGQFIDTAMYEAFMTLIPEAVIDFTLNGNTPQRIGNRDSQKAPHDIYLCRETEDWLAISVGSDKEWTALCEIMGRSDLAGDERFSTLEGRQTHADELDQAISAWSRGLDPFETAQRLQAAGISAGPVVRPDQLLSDPGLNKLGCIVETDHPVAGRKKQIGLPWRMDSAEAYYDRAPLLGEHTNEILERLGGLTAAEIAQLEAEGVLN